MRTTAGTATHTKAAVQRDEDDVETDELGVLDLGRRQANGSGDRTRASSSSFVTRRMGRYQLLEQIGEGSMGEVFIARDPYLDRRVAIKVLKENATSLGAKLVARLGREAEALARVNHPSVTSIYDVGVDGNKIYLALELVEGMTLRAWLRTSPTSEQVIDAFRQAAEGLAAAHRELLIHRDFKPDNVLITNEGVVKVTDFGLATETVGLEDPHAEEVSDSAASNKGSAWLTNTGVIHGTPAYMAPEQFDGMKITQKADQYAFGVSLFEALTRTRPFIGGSPAAITAAAISCDFAVSPKALPRRLRKAVTRMLAAEPDARFESMDVIAKMLRPPRSYRRAVAVATAMSVAVVCAFASFALGTREATLNCDAGSAEIGNVWNEERKATLKASAPLAEIDQYAVDWTRS